MDTLTEKDARVAAWHRSKGVRNKHRSEAPRFNTHRIVVQQRQRARDRADRAEMAGAR